MKIKTNLYQGSVSVNCDGCLQQIVWIKIAQRELCFLSSIILVNVGLCFKLSELLTACVSRVVRLLMIPGLHFKEMTWFQKQDGISCIKVKYICYYVFHWMWRNLFKDSRRDFQGIKHFIFYFSKSLPVKVNSISHSFSSVSLLLITRLLSPED